jgi:hypothetical protein
MSGFKAVSKAAARRQIVEDPRIEKIANALLVLHTQQEYIDEISTLWQSAQEKFLTIGRYLIQARDTLHHGEFQAMVESRLPFGVQVAYQLRMVAEAIDSGRLPSDQMPGSYATIYQLTTLKPDELDLARQRNLLRPDVKRTEVAAFKRELRRLAQSVPTCDRTGSLRQELQKLQTKAQRIALRISEIEAELEAAHEAWEQTSQVSVEHAAAANT